MAFMLLCLPARLNSLFINKFYLFIITYSYSGNDLITHNYQIKLVIMNLNSIFARLKLSQLINI